MGNDMGILRLVWYTLAICCFAAPFAQSFSTPFTASQRQQVPNIWANCFKNTRLHVKSSKWDELYDEDDELFEGVPPDMRYEDRNVIRQHKNFMAIREAGGKDACADLYVKEPGEEVLWYSGKIARVSDVSVEQAVARQWHMIETHAANMRPIELFPKKGKLEIWTAPGDSEMEVAYNRPSLVMKKMSKTAPGVDSIKNFMVGFQGEVYKNGEEGFRTWRTEDGRPARPEINPGGETRPATPEEIAQLQADSET